MQIFEKILEKLQECERQAEKDTELSEKYAEANAYGGEMIAFEKAIEIVKQEAAEYNNGWIPCSERLPKKDGFYIATLDGEIAGEEKPFSGLTEFENGKWVDDAEEYQCVLAWQPLPEPYRKGE